MDQNYQWRQGARVPGDACTFGDVLLEQGLQQQQRAAVALDNERRLRAQAEAEQLLRVKAEAERQVAQTLRAKAEAEREAEQKRRAHAEAERDAIRQSSCWRLTAPVRATIDLFRRA
jgi:hypothetical protein